MLMNSYQQMTGFVPAPKRGRPVGSGGNKRPPRTLEAIVMTTGTRVLNQLHGEGKTKKAALATALERCTSVAAGRSETLTDDLKSQIDRKADAIWSLKK